MPIYAAKLEPTGRILIPVELRRRLGLEPGEDVLIQEDADSGSITVSTRREALRRAREYFGQFSPDRMLSDELVAERRQESGQE